MLTELSLQQFRAHAATRIPLERITVLVGPNGAGKSSALEAVWLLGRLLETRAEEVFVGTRELKWLLRHGAKQLKIQISGANEEAELFDEAFWDLWALAPATDGSQTVRVDWESRMPEPRSADDASAQHVTRHLGGSPARPAGGPAGARVLRRVAWLRLDARRLAAPSVITEEIPRMAEDGYGLATVLSALKLASTDRFNAFEDATRAIVPGLKSIKFKRTRIEQQSPRALMIEGQKVVVQEKEVVIADELVLDFKDAPGRPAHAASEGTLLVLGMLAVLYSGDAPPLLLLEDVERALHPKAQRDLIEALRAALVAVPEMQIIATTHSPYLVDGLQPNEVVVLARDQAGTVAARRLSDHPKAKLLDALTTGEFWAAEGEEWVTSG